MFSLYFSLFLSFFVRFLLVCVGNLGRCCLGGRLTFIGDGGVGNLYKRPDDCCAIQRLHRYVAMNCKIKCRTCDPFGVCVAIVTSAHGSSVFSWIVNYAGCNSDCIICWMAFVPFILIFPGFYCLHFFSFVRWFAIAFYVHVSCATRQIAVLSIFFMFDALTNGMEVLRCSQRAQIIVFPISYVFCFINQLKFECNSAPW